MDILQKPYVQALVVGLFCAYFVRWAIESLSVWNRQRTIGAGTQQVVQVPTSMPFGLDLLYQTFQAMKARRLLEMTTERYRSMGAYTLRFRMMGGEYHETLEPENVRAILATDYKKWGLTASRKALFRPAIGNGIFAAEGHIWQHSREMLRPMLSRSQIARTEIYEKHAAHLIAAINRKNGKVDLAPLFFRLTLDVSLDFLLGESTESLTRDSDAHDDLTEALDRVQGYIANLSSGGLKKFSRSAKKTQEEDIKLIQNFVDGFIYRRMSKRQRLLEASDDGTSRRVLLDELVKQTTDKAQIRDEILSTLFAGRDTTAALMINVWFMLSKRPDVWNRLQSDISQLLPEGDHPTFDQLKELKYLTALLNESLRVHPVVPGNGREALEDTVLPKGGGPDGSAPIFIEKGGFVMWNAYAMQRRKDLYGEDADRFKPERWLDNEDIGEKGLRVSWSYLPFGGGARICLGQKLALAMAGYTTVRLCQAFVEIDSRDPGPWKESFTLFCTNLNGAKVALKARK